MTKAALISVSDKTGVADFAKGLSNLGYTILSSSGTAKHLQENGVDVLLVEEYTGQEEILGGRVKTLHPKVHGGILAKRNDEHLADLKKIDAFEIDVVAVNLYPFIQNLNSEAAGDYKKMIELVDIGGPAMLRAAAKNFLYVYSVIDPDDYSKVLASLDSKEDNIDLKRELSVKVFKELANYNLAIAEYFSGVGSEAKFNPVAGMVLEKQQDLRYGENPNQQAVYYRDVATQNLPWEQLGGKELSYNNLLDFDAAISCVSGIKTEQDLCVIIKHLNPCGVALAGSQSEAISKAKTSDPRSHFGGIIAFNKTLTLAAAENIADDFAEIVVAPDFEKDALAVLQKKKNLRIIKADFESFPDTEMRTAAGGILLQEKDKELSEVKAAENMTNSELSTKGQEDLTLAWQICQSVKSNAIVIVKDGTMLSSGTGQMSRIDSVELALHKAKTHKHDTQGAVAASDAFFPFADSVETLASAGIKAIITPGGSRADEEVVTTAKKEGVAILFTKDRHFRH